MTRLFKYLKPFMAPIAAVLVLLFFQALADLGLPNLMAEIIDKGVVKGDTALIYATGGRMLLVALGGAAAAITASYLSARIATGFGRDLRRSVFAHVETFSLNEFDKLGTASLITRTTNDITQVQMVILMMMRFVVSAPMMVIGGSIMAYRKDPRLSLYLIGVVPFIAAVMGFAAVKGLPLFRQIQLKIDRVNLVMREGLTGIRVIRAFNRTEHEAERFDRANLDLTATSIQVNKLMAFVMPAIMLILNLTTIIIIWLGSHRVDAGSLAVGGLMAFLQYAMQILFSLLAVGIIFVMIPRASASAERINGVFAVKSSIVDTAQPRMTDVGKRGVIEFRDVTFSYPGAEEPAIRGISFAAGPGEVTAIIGGTGSGKSTLISLIPRFYDIDSGEISVDGADIRTLTQDDLRARIGLVPQKAVLFSGTVAENIRFGKEDATDDEIRRAAEIAQAAEFIDDMAEGYASQIAQGGTNVSGGQKQRLAIARALVRRPEIFVFDDSFSALDFKTDARLRAALRREVGDSTVIIVAQRVATVMDADRILVLDQGNLVGAGTHKELMQNCAVYREIVSSQLSEEEIA